MINESAAYIIGLAVTIVWCIYTSKKRFPTEKKLFSVIFIIYLTCLAGVTLFPIVYDPALKRETDILEYRLVLIPFETILRYARIGNLFAFFVQIGGNIVMTIPFGFLLPIVVKNKPKWFYILCSLSLTLFIEFTQFFTGAIFQIFYRTADIDDVILNFTGAMLGLLFYKLLPEKIKKKCSF